MQDTKLPYQAPKLVEWGTVVDLTQAPSSCVSIDVAFSGSVCDIQLA
jgi:hypothetical protein